MNKSTIILGLGAAVIGSAILVPQAVQAYKGDPNVQGPNYSEERHQEMTQAFETNNYQAWQEQMNGQGRVSEVVNEGNFAQFAEAHQYALEGNTEEAAAIRAELGLGLQDGSGAGQNRGNRAGSGDCDGTGSGATQGYGRNNR